MDIYVLDSQLRRSEVIDSYESLIWTERFADVGDCTITMRPSREAKALLQPDTCLAIRDSYRVQKIDTVEETTDQDGRKVLKATGVSLEGLLKDRVASRVRIAAGAVQEPYDKTGKPADIAREIFDNFIRNNVVIPEDQIPFLQPGVLLSSGTIPEPTAEISISWAVGTIFDWIKKLCDMYGLGFRIVRNGDLSELYFEIYTGSNRTSAQVLNEAVIFSPRLDNLSNTSQLTSSSNYKNVAYVFAVNGSRMVYSPTVDETVSGFDRRVLMVDASDIDLEAGTALNDALDQRGKEALDEHRQLYAFDGEIPQYSDYIYGVHYRLGDIVEQRNEDEIASNMRVTEQIIVSDREGVRSYPTLTMDTLITPGSWYGWNATQVWDEVEGVWDDLP